MALVKDLPLTIDRTQDSWFETIKRDPRRTHLKSYLQLCQTVIHLICTIEHWITAEDMLEKLELLKVVATEAPCAIWLGQVTELKEYFADISKFLRDVHPHVTRNYVEVYIALRDLVTKLGGDYMHNLTSEFYQLSCDDLPYRYHDMPPSYPTDPPPYTATNSEHSGGRGIGSIDWAYDPGPHDLSPEFMANALAIFEARFGPERTDDDSDTSSTDSIEVLLDIERQEREASVFLNQEASLHRQSPESIDRMQEYQAYLATIDDLTREERRVCVASLHCWFCSLNVPHCVCVRSERNCTCGRMMCFHNWNERDVMRLIRPAGEWDEHYAFAYLYAMPEHRPSLIRSRALAFYIAHFTGMDSIYWSTSDSITLWTLRNVGESDQEVPHTG